MAARKASLVTAAVAATLCSVSSSQATGSASSRLTPPAAYCAAWMTLLRGGPSQEFDEIAGSLCTALGRCPGPQDRSVAIKPITELRRSFP